jgi:hypothetical protein
MNATVPPRNAARQAKTRRRAAASPDAHAFTIPDAQAMGAPGRTKIYELAKTGELTLVRIGGRTMVTGTSLRSLLGVTE